MGISFGVKRLHEKREVARFTRDTPAATLDHPMCLLTCSLEEINNSYGNYKLKERHSEWR
jgi:hypothetical protein